MNATQILLGFSRKDISPIHDHKLSGYGDDPSRSCLGILDPVFGTCLAISDVSGQTVLLYSVDLLLVNDPAMQVIRPAIAKKTGITEDHIHIAATHTHAGPTLAPEIPETKRYLEYLAEQLCLAAEEALSDRCAADIYIGTTDIDGLNFVRHYKTAAGTYMGDNFGDKTLPLTGHAGDADKQMQLIRFVRGGKQDVILTNWQAHGKMSSTINSEFGRAHRNHLSADYIGYARNQLEKDTGASVIYFSGAAGNLNPDSRILSETPTKDPAEYGKTLAAQALKGLKDMRKISGGPVCCRQQFVDAPIDHSDDCKLAIAQKVWSVWAEDQQKSRALAAAHGFNSPYAARDVVRRFHSGDHMTLELNTVTIGQLAFIAAPYEMFCENGVFLKENAPFSMTVIMTCANGYYSYLASKRAFDHGGYEVDSRRFPEGTAEKMVDTFLNMLT